MVCGGAGGQDRTGQTRERKTAADQTDRGCDMQKDGENGDAIAYLVPELDIIMAWVARFSRSNPPVPEDEVLPPPPPLALLLPVVSCGFAMLESNRCLRAKLTREPCVAARGNRGCRAVRSMRCDACVGMSFRRRMSFLTLFVYFSSRYGRWACGAAWRGTAGEAWRGDARRGESLGRVESSRTGRRRTRRRQQRKSRLRKSGDSGNRR